MGLYAGKPSPSQIPPVPHREPLVSNAVLATMIFVLCEAMLFAGLVSAFLIVRAQATAGWPPPGQPRLPFEETAINTVALLLSGVLIYFANRAYRRDPDAAQRPLLFSILLGAFFVLFQGFEWVALLGEGLTLTSSQHGSFFYLIIGMHALHAIVALGVLAWVFALLRSGRLLPPTFHGAQVFWYFVVGLWPVLYLQVYL